MKQHPDKQTSEIRHTAEWYVTRLYSGEVTATDEAEFFEWLQSHESNRHKYERALQVWDRAGELKEHEDVIEMRLSARRRKRMHRHRLWVAAGIAATVVLATALMFASWPYVVEGTASPQRFETAIGESKAVTLADGTQLNLNTASQVIVDFTPTSRRLILDFGEVYIHVEKDPTRPFSVIAGDRVVTALGTEFSVTRLGDVLEVAVAEGTVAITKQGVIPPVVLPTGAVREVDDVTNDSVILRGGAIAEFKGDHFESLAKNNLLSVDAAHSWLDGVVIFEAKSLIQVISELNRYSPIKVLIEDSTITELPVSAVLQVDNVELFLSSLEAIHPVRVTRYSDRYVIVHR